MRTPPAGSEARFDPVRLHARLLEHYGPSGWWPGETPLEVMAGAVLTQNTAWKNVEKAISNLKAASLMDVEGLHRADEGTLADIIRPSGYYNVKAARLRNLAAMIAREFGGSLDRLFSLEDAELRARLLAVNGIGRETADSICCYAAHRLFFVVDAYTRRILSRHGVIQYDEDYEKIRSLFEDALPRRIDVYKDLHAHLVFVGKDHCRARVPGCGGCPLKDAAGISGPSVQKGLEGPGRAAPVF